MPGSIECESGEMEEENRREMEEYLLAWLCCEYREGYLDQRKAGCDEEYGQEGSEWPDERDGSVECRLLDDCDDSDNAEGLCEEVVAGPGREQCVPLRK